jgi:catechol 2,3-dioxygenase-like lactoylglutathione lyase family enzyme
MIDLIEWKHPRDDTPPYPHLYHLGVARIALRTTDLASDLAALRSIGAELIAEPATVAGLGSAGTRFVCFKDPDGTTLELVEVLEA